MFIVFLYTSDYISTLSLEKFKTVVTNLYTTPLSFEKTYTFLYCPAGNNWFVAVIPIVILLKINS